MEHAQRAFVRTSILTEICSSSQSLLLAYPQVTESKVTDLPLKILLE